MEFEIQLYSNMQPMRVARLVSCPLESTFAEFADVIRAAFNWRTEHSFDFKVRPKTGRTQSQAEAASKNAKMHEIWVEITSDTFRIEKYLPGAFAWRTRPSYLHRVVPYDVPLSRDSLARVPDN